MKIKPDSKIKQIILTVCAVLTFAVIFTTFTLIIVDNNKTGIIVPTNSTIEQASIQSPDLIEIEYLAEYKNFYFSVTGAPNTSVEVDVENEDIATIDDAGSKIFPHSIGETKITVSVLCDPIIKKETIVRVVDCTSEINFSLYDTNNNPITTIFLNETYILKVGHNILPNQMPNILCSTENLRLIQTTLTEYIFEFSTNQELFELTYEYNGNYELTKHFETHVYSTLTDFSVNFSDVSTTNNIINLYMFNNEKLLEANDNNIFNETTFTIEQQPNTIDDIAYNIENQNIADVVNNKLIAKADGETTISFTSSISNVTKTYTVRVSSVYLNSLVINNSQTEFGTNANISLELNGEYDFSFSATPTYALNNVEILYDDTAISYSNETIKLTGPENTVVYLRINNEIVYTLNITYIAPPTITHEINVQTTYNCDAELNSNSLTITNVQTGAQMQISCFAYENNVKQLSQEFTATFSNGTCTLLEPVTNGNITFGIMNTGTCTLTINDINNNVEILLNIIVN